MTPGFDDTVTKKQSSSGFDACGKAWTALFSRFVVFLMLPLVSRTLPTEQGAFPAAFAALTTCLRRLALKSASWSPALPVPLFPGPPSYAIPRPTSPCPSLRVFLLPGPHPRLHHPFLHPELEFSSLRIPSSATFPRTLPAESHREVFKPMHSRFLSHAGYCFAWPCWGHLVFKPPHSCFLGNFRKWSK